MSCVRNGRRVREAWPWLQDRIEELHVTGTNLAPDACEGNLEWCADIRSMCMKAASEIKRCNKYLGMAPWLLTTAITTDGAKSCIDQVSKRDLADHDPATRDLLQRVGNDLKAGSAAQLLGKRRTPSTTRL